MKKYFKYISFCLIILLIGCAGNKKENVVITYNKKELPFIPAGVDSAIAVEARAKTKKLFVSFQRQKDANVLLNFTDAHLLITEELYQQIKKKKDLLDENRNKIRVTQEKYEKQKTIGLEEKKQLELLKERTNDDSSTVDIVTSLVEYYLDHSSEKLDEAYKLDPFNLNILMGLARGYEDKGLMYEDSLSHKKAISSLKKFLRYNKGYHHVYAAIGRNYYQLKDWQNAYDYACQAKKILLLTSYFDAEQNNVTTDTSGTEIMLEVDPKEYYNCLLQKGMAEMKVYLADSALSSFREAIVLSPTKNDSDYINQQINEYILWDDRNIKAAEQKFVIRDSLISGNIKWAKDAYLDLIPKLKTPKARHEIIWRLARIEYNYLEQYEEAANRLYVAISEADSNKNTKNYFEAPNDSMYKKYFKECGQMYFNHGTKCRNEGLFAKARLFFARDTTIDWKGRGKAFLPLVQLVEVPENLSPKDRLDYRNRKIIKLLNRAKHFVDDFDVKELNLLYRPLIMIYRQKREMQKAGKEHREWQYYLNKRKNAK